MVQLWVNEQERIAAEIQIIYEDPDTPVLQAKFNHKIYEVMRDPFGPIIGAWEVHELSRQ